MSNRLQQLISLGREHYHANEYDKAEPYLAEAVAQRPTFADVYNMLGVIYHAQGRFQDAEDAFETALLDQPQLHRGRAQPERHLQRPRQVRPGARDLQPRVVSNSYSQSHNLDPFARGKLACRARRPRRGLRRARDLRRQRARAQARAGAVPGLRRSPGAARQRLPRHGAAPLGDRRVRARQAAQARLLASPDRLGVVYFSLDRKDEAVRSGATSCPATRPTSARSCTCAWSATAAGLQGGSALRDVTEE
ncbi:MAG: tetratricopeptide repeat protein [Kofleriaceae bacterium]|nr:tetratricopeptide repeat protein [Kofleriaceae bacterium]